MVLINYWAVLVSAVLAMVVGSLWYGPLFGKVYMKAKGMDTMSPEDQAAMKKKMVWSYLGQFVASLVTFYVLAWFINVTETHFMATSYAAGETYVGLWGGVHVAFWVWLGFLVPMKFSEAIWGGKMTLFWISISEALITLLATGAIIGAWKVVL